MKFGLVEKCAFELKLGSSVAKVLSSHWDGSVDSLWSMGE